jgi:hypothetical protein
MLGIYRADDPAGPALPKTLAASDGRLASHQLIGAVTG